MQFTGTSLIALPQVSQFYFNLTGISVSQTGLMSFEFFDTGGNAFAFNFSGGFISTNKIISTYNTTSTNHIYGYISNGNLSYKINGITNQQNITFTSLSGMGINAGSGLIQCDVIVDSNPINYSVSFSPIYNYGGLLTGTIVSNVAFPISAPSFVFFGSNKSLLAAPPTSMFVNIGTNNFTFQDTDSDFIEYQDNFYVSFPTSFGNVGGDFTSYRSGITNQCFTVLSDTPSNIYYQASAFSGEMNGNAFVYIDQPVQYDLDYGFSSYNFLGYPQIANLSVVFTPIFPANNSGCVENYITGYSVLSGGNYLKEPNINFSQYFYVTGLQTSLNKFLFSSGCANSLSVSFSGGNPISGASGVLILKPIRVSGVYSTGISNYKIISGYSGISDGWGYQSIPEFVLATGGGCYSVPDYVGTQTSQFTFATGYGAIYGQAYGLTGIPLFSTGLPMQLTGVEITNIGFGYNTTFPPTMTLQRVSGDTTIGDAAVSFLYKLSGLYDFTNVWDISCNFNTGYNGLSGYSGYYSGNFVVSGDGNLSIIVNLSGIDNTNPISGLLSLTLTNPGNSTNIQDAIIQSRTFNLFTGALLPNSYPTINFFPLPDLLMYLDSDPSYIAYLNSLGPTQNNIINF